jgi:hypothetical protein
MIADQRLEFLNFDKFRDSAGTVHTLNWVSLEAMVGQWAWPYLEGLRWTRQRSRVLFGRSSMLTHRDKPTLDNMWPTDPAIAYYADADPGPSSAFGWHEGFTTLGHIGGFGTPNSTFMQWPWVWTSEVLMSVAWDPHWPNDNWPTTLARAARCLAAAGVDDGEYFAHLTMRLEARAIDPTNKYDCQFRHVPAPLVDYTLFYGPLTASLLYNEGLVNRWLETNDTVPEP